MSVVAWFVGYIFASYLVMFWMLKYSGWNNGLDDFQTGIIWLCSPLSLLIAGSMCVVLYVGETLNN